MRRLILLIYIILLSVCFMGCSSQNTPSAPPDLPLRDNTPVCLLPEASGVSTCGDEIVSLDISNTSDGYLMLRYTGTCANVKFQILAPNHVDYTYTITPSDTYQTFSLPGGDGGYTVRLLEAVSSAESKYAVAFTQDFQVMISDEFLPFLYPNCYVSFKESSDSVQKAKELSADCYSDLDVINRIYHHVTQNITYDTKKAADIAYGYIPDPDHTLATGKGICFDYASLMSAMLRSQSIPTRLEVGYAGDVYHAWISCYVDEVGWVDNIIEFDGKNWSLLDPTLAASNESSVVQEYIGDGSSYLIKYTY